MCRSPACASSSRRIPGIPPISRRCGDSATSSFRTASLNDAAAAAVAAFAPVAHLHPARRVGGRDGKPGLWLSFHIDDDEYWLRIPRERIERQIALRWLGWGALALALSLLAAYFLVSRLNRPLQALARAAGAIGKGKTPDPVSESGPEEIPTLS